MIYDEKITNSVSSRFVIAGLFMTGGSKASIADTSIPDNEIASSVNQTDSPLSANATITIIRTTPPLPTE